MRMETNSGEKKKIGQEKAGNDVCRQFNPDPVKIVDKGTSFVSVGFAGVGTWGSCGVVHLAL